jgi:hypothetical protein
VLNKLANNLSWSYLMRIEELLIESHNLEEGPKWDAVKKGAGQLGQGVAQGVGMAAQGAGAVAGGAMGAWDRAKQGFAKGRGAVNGQGAPAQGGVAPGGAQAGGQQAGGSNTLQDIQAQIQAKEQELAQLKSQAKQANQQQQQAPAQQGGQQAATPANSTTNSLDTPKQTAPASAEAQPASPEEQPAPASNGPQGGNLPNKGFGFHPHTGQPFASAKERADYDASPEAKISTDEWEASQGKGAAPTLTPPAGVTPPADAKTTTPPAGTAPANTKDPKAIAAATKARLQGQRAAGKSMATSTSGNFSNYVRGGGGQTLQGADKNGNPIFKQNVKREDIQFESKFLGMMI